MAQHDYDIADADGATFLADLNNMAEAIATNNSGASEPATTFAYMWWPDTTGGWMKQRNAANSAWIRRWPLGTNGAVDIASAATLDLDANAANSGIIRVTGTTATTAITLAEGQVRTLRAAGAWPITHGASLIVPGAASYTCAAGDLVTAIGEAAGVVRLAIAKADGTPVVPSGVVVQHVEATPYSTWNTSLTTAIPMDGTKPQQSTDGTLILSKAITPRSASNRLLIEITADVVAGSGSIDCGVALHQDTTEDALAGAVEQLSGANAHRGMTLRHTMVAGTTSSTTFKAHFGPGSGTMYLNGNSVRQPLGGIEKVTMTITELTP